MRILIADDDNLSRESIAKFVRKNLHHKVDEADSGLTAWDKYQSNPYPLVISDIRMPGMGGLELLAKINNSENSKHTKVVMITGFGELQSSIQALRLNAFDYLEKPIDVNELANVIQRIENLIQ